MEKLKFYTGYLPREIQLLKQIGNFEAYETDRIAEFKSRALRLEKSLDDFQHKEFHEFLKMTLIPRYHNKIAGEQLDKGVVGSFYDKGLFYKSGTGHFECISGPAKKALNSFLSSALQRDLKPIDSVEVCFCFEKG